PDEPEPRSEGGPGQGRGAASARTVTPKTPQIDWAGLKRRTRQVTRLGSVFNYLPARDGRTVIFVASEGGTGGGGGRGAPAGRRGVGGAGGGAGVGGGAGGRGGAGAGEERPRSTRSRIMVSG